MNDKYKERISKRRHLKRIIIGCIGGLLLLVGVVAIPYPGPGWLIVISSLALLATEFDWAKKLLGVVKTRYDAWQEWMSRQPLHIKSIFWLLTAAVVVVTIYLLNGYGFINDWLNLDLDWVSSPLPFF